MLCGWLAHNNGQGHKILNMIDRNMSTVDTQTHHSYVRTRVARTSTRTTGAGRLQGAGANVHPGGNCFLKILLKCLRFGVLWQKKDLQRNPYIPTDKRDALYDHLREIG